MQSGSLVSGDVLTYTSRVLVNGVQRNASSWSDDRELSGDLPQQVVAASGITQASGTIVWAPEKDVEARPTNPWNPAGWMPRRGDRVEIFASDGVTEWKQFHGVIDKTTGDLSAGFQSTIIDDYDKLSASVSHAALLRVMPPSGGGGDPYRGIGLMPQYYVDYALRQAGFNCTPNAEYASALTVHMQGSLWPFRGSLSSNAGGSKNPGNHSAPWGLALSDFDVTYSLWGSHNGSESLQMTLMAAPEHSQGALIQTNYGSTFVQLVISASRTAQVWLGGTSIATLVLGSATIVSMLAKSGTVTLRTNTGATASGSMVVPSGAVSSARLYAAPGSRIAGAQVSFPTRTVDELASTRFTPNARLDTASLFLTGVIDAAPTIEGATAESLLSEIGSATLSAMWIDETGVMQWVASDALRERASSRTVTTLDDVFSLDWEDGLLGTASKVSAKGRKPAVTKGRWKTALLARGGGSGSMKSGDEAEIILEPDSDTDWILPSTTFLRVGGSGAIWGSANNPEYSLTGLYYSADGGTTEASGLNITITTESLGLQKVLVKYVAGTWPSDVEGVLATSPTAATLWPKNRDKELPKLVGSGKIVWTDQQVTAIGAGGPGPELVHDAGPWGCRTDSTIMLDRYATYIQTQTSTPHPVISGMRIVPDPRLQLGDVVTVQSGLMGATLNVLITGVSKGFDAGGMSMSLDVRVISVSITGVTYEQWNSSGAPITYAQLNALSPTPQTYTQFNADR